MLAPKNRLRSKKDIERILKYGQKYKEGLLLLRARENNLSVFRIGFVVSQKISKKAVIRNKIKRRLRSAVGGRLKSIKSGIDMLFVALPGIEKNDYSYIENCVNSLLAKSRHLN